MRSLDPRAGRHQEADQQDGARSSEVRSTAGRPSRTHTTTRGGDATAAVSDPDAAVKEGEKHGREAGEEGERSSGGGGQEGV